MNNGPFNLGLEPGFHEDVSESDYHGDRLCAEPTLSRSLAETLIFRSPLHAFHKHPQLGGVDKEQESDASDAMDFGSLGHKLLLDAGADIAIGEWDSWRKEEAKAFRREARAKGRIPCLRPVYERADSMRCVARNRIIEIGLGSYFDAAEPEVTAIFDEASNVRCRVRFDKILINDFDATIFDLKITENAHPKVCERQIQNMHYDLQDSAYRTAVERLCPHLASRVRMIFLFIEAESPFVVTPIELNGEFRANGTIKWNHAVQVWKKCREMNQWPAYTNEVIKAAPKEWALMETMGLEMPKFNTT